VGATAIGQQSYTFVNKTAGEVLIRTCEYGETAFKFQCKLAPEVTTIIPLLSPPVIRVHINNHHHQFLVENSADTITFDDNFPDFITTCFPCSRLTPTQKIAAVVTTAVAAAKAAPVAAVATVKALGFGAGGVIAQTTAAGMMSAAGSVKAGGVIATLQSVGATTSLGAATVPVAIATVVVVGVGGYYAVKGGMNDQEDCWDSCQPHSRL